MITKDFVSIKTDFQMQRTQTIIHTQELGEYCFHEFFLKNLLENELQTTEMSMVYLCMPKGPFPFD